MFVGDANNIFKGLLSGYLLGHCKGASKPGGRMTHSFVPASDEALSLRADEYFRNPWGREAHFSVSEEQSPWDLEVRLSNITQT